MNTLTYAKAILSSFDFLEFTEAKKAALITVAYIKNEADSRFIEFFNEVEFLIKTQK